MDKDTNSHDAKTTSSVVSTMKLFARTVYCGLDNTRRLVGPFGTLLCNLRTAAVRGGTLGQPHAHCRLNAVLNEVVVADTSSSAIRSCHKSASSRTAAAANQAHTAATQFTHADLGASRSSRFRGAVARKPSLRDASLGSDSPFVAFSVPSCPRLPEDVSPLTHHGRKEVASCSSVEGGPRHGFQTFLNGGIVLAAEPCVF